MGLFAQTTKRGRSKDPVSSQSKGPQYIFIDTPKSPKSPRKPTKTKSQDLSNAKIDLLTSKLTSYRNSKRKESRGPTSVDLTIGTRSVDHTTVVASGSRRQSRSIDQQEKRENVPRSIMTRSKSPSRRFRNSKSKSPSRPTRSTRSKSASRRSRSAEPSTRKSRSTTPREMRIQTVPHGTESSKSEQKPLTPRSILASLAKSPSLSKSVEPSCSTPKSILTVEVGHGSQRETRTVQIKSSSRSRSAEPSVRKSRSVDIGTSSAKKLRSKSVEPAEQKVHRSMSTDTLKKSKSRSRSPFGRLSRSTFTDTEKTEYCKNSQSTPNMTSLSTSNKSATSTTTTSSTSSTKKLTSMSDLVQVAPRRLDKEMTFLADGMGLDRNTRYLLAAFDARSVDDFYLMSDGDFSSLIQKAKSIKHELPPLQIRKVQMLRRWIKELVDDHLNDDNESNSGRVSRKRSFRIIPRDWKEQYKNDLPHLKLQLRQQSDSLYQRIKNFSETFACGASSIY